MSQFVPELKDREARKHQFLAAFCRWAMKREGAAWPEPSCYDTIAFSGLALPRALHDKESKQWMLHESN
jgi:hypothetical protein